VTLQILYTFDLINLGYHVILQDTDVIWLQDVTKFTDFDNRYDIIGSFDGRYDLKGPINTGFMRIKPSCHSQVFMLNLIHYIGLLIVGRSDQTYFNMFLREYDFKTMTLNLFSPEQFISGWQWETGKRYNHPALSNRNHAWLVHAAWTSGHIDKIRKFHRMNAWFYTSTQCPHFWNESVLPDGALIAISELINTNYSNIWGTWTWQKEAKSVWWTRIGA